MGNATQIKVGDPIRHLSKTAVRRATAHQVRMIPVVRAVLISVAQQRSTITYKQLSEAIESFNARSIGQMLDVICLDCGQRGEPALTALVVSGATGIASREFVYVRSDRPLPYDLPQNAPVTESERAVWSEIMNACYDRWAEPVKKGKRVGAYV